MPYKRPDRPDMLAMKESYRLKAIEQRKEADEFAIRYRRSLGILPEDEKYLD